MMFFNLHTHSRSAKTDVVELLNRYPEESSDETGYFSIGIHPWRIDPEKLESELRIVEEALMHRNCLALGECGLDKRIDTPIDIQQQVFERQLELAMHHRKPVVLHCVAAYQEAIKIKQDKKPEVPLIIHGFSKNFETAKQLLDHGFYLSFGKYLLRNPDLEKVFKQVPDNHFFLETDTIDEGIDEVYAKAAACKGLSVEQISKIINENLITVFGLKIQ